MDIKSLYSSKYILVFDTLQGKFSSQYWNLTPFFASGGLQSTPQQALQLSPMPKASLQGVVTGQATALVLMPTDELQNPLNFSSFSDSLLQQQPAASLERCKEHKGHGIQLVNLDFATPQDHGP